MGQRFIFILLVLGGLGLVSLANGRYTLRYRQVLMPIIAIAHIGLALLLSHWLGAWLYALTQRFELFGEFAQQLCEGPLFDFVFLASFALVKFAVLKFVSRFEDLYLSFFGMQVEVFYERDEEAGRWFVRDSSAALRKLASRVMLCSLVVAVAACYLFAESTGVHPSYIPLVILEFAAFLGGETKGEYRESVSSEEGFSHSVIAYANLERVLRHFFGDRLLVSKSRGGRHAAPTGNADLCAELMASSDPMERMSGAYFEAAVKKGLIGKGGDNDGLYDELMHDRVIDSTRLMKGQSVLFASPFFGDFVPYVFFPVNTMLLRGKRVLILVGSNVTKHLMPGFVDEGISFVTNVPTMWQVSELAGDGSAKPDVALLSFSELDDIDLLIANRPFFAQVGMCLIIDPSSMLATYQIGLSMLAEYLAAGQTPTYCVFDRNEDGLVDSLSHALRTNLVEVGATDATEGTSFGMYWSVDGPQLQNRLMPGVARYLGVGTELALVALREQVSKVTWAGRAAAPLLDVRWIDGQYYTEMFDFAGLPQEQAEIDRRFEFVEEPWSLRRAENRFMVVEDEYNNLFEAYRQFSTRGSVQSFVNVLAPNYLMRGYMADNPQTFVADPKAVPALAPDVSKAPRNAVYSIVLTMLQTGDKMEESDIAARLRYVGVSFDDAGEALAELMVEYFSSSNGDYPESYLVCDEREIYDSELGVMVLKRFFGLTPTALDSHPFRGLRNVPLITELPDGSYEVVGSRVFDLVYQSWLPGQFLTLDGKYYEVVSITLDGGILLRRAADHFVSRRYYRQLRKYTVHVDKEAARDPGRTLSQVKAQVLRAQIDVDTEGYLDMNDFGDVAHARRVELPGIARRSYENKDVLCIELEGATAEITRTIATVMSELLVTLYPKDYQYAAVLTAAAAELPDGILYRFEGADEQNVIFIVEDSSIDLGLVSSIDRNLQRILETCFEYLDWHEEMIQRQMFSSGVIEVGELPEEAEEVDLTPRENTSARRGCSPFAWLMGLFGRDKGRKGRNGEPGTSGVQGQTPDGQTGTGVVQGQKPDGEASTGGEQS